MYDPIGLVLSATTLAAAGTRTHAGHVNAFGSASWTELGRVAEEWMPWLPFDPQDPRTSCAAISGGYFTCRPEEGIWQS